VSNWVYPISPQGNPVKKNERIYSNETHIKGIAKRPNKGFVHSRINAMENIPT
jgi:hypothetical protein